jgi:excisionase family DNA binding protein
MVITNLNTHAASYVSVAELADYWEVTRQLVYKRIQSGLLPAMRLGPRCFRIRTADALAFERHVSSKWQKAVSSSRGTKPMVAAVIVPLRDPEV